MSQWIDPYGAEITEFAGHNDDCGPCANEVCLATVQRRKPDTAHMNAIRARDLAHTPPLLRAGGGQTVDELVDDVHAYEPAVTLTQTPPHGQTNYDAPDDTTLKAALDGAIARGNSCVLNLGNAQALPGNERGVQWHFVACIGGNDTHYLISNGDEIPFDGQPNWVTWQDLTNAKLVSVVEYVKGATPMLPANFVSAGWSDDGTLTTGPAAPDGTRYTIRGLMRTRILALIASGAVRPDDFPMELEHQDVSADRYVQTCNLTRWILQHHPEHAGTPDEWELFMSNLGASVLAVEKALAAANTQLTHITAANDALQQQIADQDTSNKALLSEKDAIIANLTTQLQNTPLPAAVQAKVAAFDALKAALAA